MFERSLHSAGTSVSFQDYDVFPRDKNHSTPQISISKGPKVTTTPQESPRDSPFGQETSHSRPTLNYPNRHLAR